MTVSNSKDTNQISQLHKETVSETNTDHAQRRTLEKNPTINVVREIKQDIGPMEARMAMLDQKPFLEAGR